MNNNDDPIRYERPSARCNGLGTRVIGDTVKFCPACDGTGVHTESELFEISLSELQHALTERIHEAPKVPCDKCDIPTVITSNRTFTGLEIISTCPKCGETFVVMEFLQQIGGASLN